MQHHISCDICFDDSPDRKMATLGCMCKNMHVCEECCENYYKNKFIPVCSVCKRIDTKRDCSHIEEQTLNILKWNRRFFGWFLSSCTRQRYHFKYIENHKKEFLDVHDALLEELCDVKEEISWIVDHEIDRRRFRVECGVNRSLKDKDTKGCPFYYKSIDGVFIAYVIVYKIDK
jgi:hypothetical protein